MAKFQFDLVSPERLLMSTEVDQVDVPGREGDFGVLAGHAPTVGVRVAEIALPEGSLIISVLREGTGFVPKPDTVIEAGDEVLLVLDPGLEEAITAYFAPNGQPSVP